jgi:hypothetical protein
MGYCAGFADPGFLSHGPGYGFRAGGGIGRGSGRRFGLGRVRGWRHTGFGRFWGYPYPEDTPYSTFPPLTEEQEMDALEKQAKMLENELKQLKRRQAELKRPNTKKSRTNE